MAGPRPQLARAAPHPAHAQPRRRAAAPHAGGAAAGAAQVPAVVARALHRQQRCAWQLRRWPAALPAGCAAGRHAGLCSQSAHAALHCCVGAAQAWAARRCPSSRRSSTRGRCRQRVRCAGGQASALHAPRRARPLRPRLRQPPLPAGLTAAAAAARPPADIYITHSGDAFDRAVLAAMKPATRNLLARRQHPQQARREGLGRRPVPAAPRAQAARRAVAHAAAPPRRWRTSTCTRCRRGSWRCSRSGSPTGRTTGLQSLYACPGSTGEEVGPPRRPFARALPVRARPMCPTLCAPLPPHRPALRSWRGVAGEWPSNMPGCPCPLSAERVRVASTRGARDGASPVRSTARRACAAALPAQAAYRVARTMFETAGLPRHLAEHVKVRRGCAAPPRKQTAS